MPSIRFYPLGNADCTRIDLADGRQVLVDFGRQSSDRPDDKRIDLAQTLRDDLDADGREGYAVVAFTHVDDDHIHGIGSFFRFEHDRTRQGADRARIETLWVPAAAILEENLSGEAKLVQDEARYRLKRGKDVRVFSRPGRLEQWLRRQGLSVEDVEHCITNAGETVPGFRADGDEGVEFFIHAPYAWRMNKDDRDEKPVDRNGNCLVFQARFVVDGTRTDVLFSADIDHENWQEIVRTTRRHGRDAEPEARLDWHVVKLAHHCSYLGLGPERGATKTEPAEEVCELYEQYRRGPGLIVSSSDPIPTPRTTADADKQPPHRQAANYYKEDALGGAGSRFLVTMERPSVASPRPIVLTIDHRGAVHEKSIGSGTRRVTESASPRAGRR